MDNTIYCVQSTQHHFYYSSEKALVDFTCLFHLVSYQTRMKISLLVLFLVVCLIATAFCQMGDKLGAMDKKDQEREKKKAEAIAARKARSSTTSHSTTITDEPNEERKDHAHTSDGSVTA